MHFLFPIFVIIIVLLDFAKEKAISTEAKEAKNDWTAMCKANITVKEYEKLFPKHADKYLFASWTYCGGISNQMWRFVSLYGIGKPYGRKPIYTEKQNCREAPGDHPNEGACEKNPTEVQNDYFFIKEFSPDCCSYVDPEKFGISKIKETYLEIESNYLQSYKFFENRRTEIRQIFQIGHELCKTVDQFKKELFGDDQSHKFCVHIRRGDFISLGLETKKDFAEKGIEFGFHSLKKTFNNTSISVVLMGKEKDFLKDLTINQKLFSKVYLPKSMPRANDFAFASTACDSLLITAQSSTYAWWIAYLMPDNATIFYNSKFDKAVPHTRDNFLPEWVPIELVNGKIMVSNGQQPAPSHTQLSPQAEEHNHNDLNCAGSLCQDVGMMGLVIVILPLFLCLIILKRTIKKRILRKRNDEHF
ncbi:hypothetical protein niasHT_036196 [Heterodera trifolii]|uniref:Uncharacterized protein n=1 Tax=Heterodera trifolii TaxID=157864 RepID=A0ABD2J0L9_9BILA